LKYSETVFCHFAAVGGKPIPVSHMTLPTQLQQHGAACMTTSAQPVSGVATIVKQQQQPMVAKVLTSTQGQVISMESLLAHQKQHGTLPQGAQNHILALYNMCMCHPHQFTCENFTFVPSLAYSRRLYLDFS
jgi:hypothetical protein